ncbi:hypothetical protein IWW41_000847 [Coemansia sp. RSA 2522]|nr:hypothetical protein GGH14_005793 [Coemansia sp. RSA 370]KAJ2435502.1 hypothetical protein IWW41_000847 [Coemansia sp. RSA 2522]
MLFTRTLLAQKRQFKFGDKTLPKLKALPQDRLTGMSKRQLCWTVIIMTIPFIIVSGNIVYKRLVLGEEKRRRLVDGGMDSSYMLDNLGSARSLKLGKYSPEDDQHKSTD